MELSLNAEITCMASAVGDLAGVKERFGWNTSAMKTGSA
jgi:hypothetical protein